MKELAMAAGAGQALVWQGVPLTDEQLQSGHYPQQAKCWHLECMGYDRKFMVAG